MPDSGHKNWGYPTDTAVNLQVPPGDMEKAAIERKKSAAHMTHRKHTMRLLCVFGLVSFLLFALGVIFLDLRREEMVDLGFKARLYWFQIVQSIKSNNLFTSPRTAMTGTSAGSPAVEKPVFSCNGKYTDRPDDPGQCKPVNASKVRDDRGNEFYTAPWKGNKSESAD